MVGLMLRFYMWLWSWASRKHQDLWMRHNGIGDPQTDFEMYLNTFYAEWRP